MLYNWGMAKLKKKTLTSPSVKIVKEKLFSKAVINQMDKAVAKTQGLTLKDYQKRKKLFQKQSEEYRKTHWVSDLTEAQLYFIATSQEKEPYYYVGKPLSKMNIDKLNHFKQHNKGYLEWLSKINRLRKIRDGIEKPLEPFKKLREEYQAIGKRLRSSFLPEQEVLRQMQKKGLDALENLSNPDLFKGWKKISTKWSPIMGSSQVNPVNFFLDDMVCPPPPNIRGVTGTFTYNAKDGQWHKDEPIDKAHGLNTLMKKHGFSSALQIPNHYLDTFDDPSKADYFVDSFDNPIALAKAVGVTPQKIFEILCREIKVSMRHYRELALMGNVLAVEGLVNEWNRRHPSEQSKYPYSEFFNSKFRKDWSEKYGWDWNDYKRFVEQFPKWVKIFNARAYKKEKVKKIKLKKAN